MTDFSWTGLSPLLPEIFLTLSGLFLLVLGVFRGNDSTRALCWITTAVFLLGGFLTLNVEDARTPLLNGFLITDGFGNFIKLLIMLGMAAAMALSTRYLEQENIVRFEYPILLIFAAVGMLLMVSANNLLSMYMGLELQSLSLYVLAAIRRDDAYSSEAGLKYFVLGALASGLLLFGASLIYGYTGAISFDAIGAALVNKGATPDLGLVFGLVFLLAGIAFKISAVPFHMWTPDVYEGAPTSVTALFAMVPKVAAIALLMRVLYGPFGGIAPQWQQIVWFLSAASMIWGAFAAIGQTNIKRLMAYSSIGNIGYALIGVVAGSAATAGAVSVYLMIYMVMTAGVFGIILAMRRNGQAAEKIEDFAGLSTTAPLLAWSMALLMFSMTGIPPLAGFIGKLVIFQAGVAGGFYVLSVLGVLGSVVAAYYYLKIIKVMFFDESVAAIDRETGWGVRAVIAASVLFIVFFLIHPALMTEAGYQSAATLFAE